MNTEWSFRISAELKNILGRDLIINSNIAVLELVKNSFDAHATEVNITFDRDCLVIADNGKGMSEEDVLNKWLFVAYSAKSDGSEDANYRDNIKRKFAGAKGIGRLSCDRLGRYLTLTTKSEADEHVVELTIDWSEFESDSKQEFNRILVAHRLLDASEDFPNGKTGTILRFSGLRDTWGEKEILKLKKSLEKMINPFNGADNFRIIFQVPGERENDARKRKESARLRQEWETLTEPKRVEAVNLEKSIINGPVTNSIAEVLNLKTTRIESVLKGDRIYTCLSDRGEKIYEIEEFAKFPLLEDATITLFYLNKQAKYNFSMMMGTQPVNYGSVFLFRNGFRIMPYGEFGDDSWGIDRRTQQGYNRTLGSRQVLGRVDVETIDVDAFKEVSSRDGGLIKTPAYEQLMDFFNLTHRRLERYVVGVLWGGGFIQREYFHKIEDAQKLRHKLHEDENESATIDHVLSNIGSKVDFLQIVKSLANDDTINLLYYNENLANIVANVDDTEIIQSQMLEDFRKVASKTNDSVLLQKLSEFEQQVDELRRQRDAAKKKATIEKERANEAVRQAQDEREKRVKEEALRVTAEKERDAQIQKNKYLNATRDTSQEVEDLMHAVLLCSTELNSLVDIQEDLLSQKILDRTELKNNLKDIRINLRRIKMLSGLVTRADAKLLREAIDVDLFAYTKEFMAVFEKKYKCVYVNENKGDILKKLPLLDFSLILLNLVSNCGKNNANRIKFIFTKNASRAVIQISDNGDGVDLKKFTKESIFEVGVTNRKEGSGIGLSTVKTLMEDNNIQGKVECLGNGLNEMKGATFQLIFY